MSCNDALGLADYASRASEAPLHAQVLPGHNSLAIRSVLPTGTGFVVVPTSLKTALHPASTFRAPKVKNFIPGSPLWGSGGAAFSPLPYVGESLALIPDGQRPGKPRKKTKISVSLLTSIKNLLLGGFSFCSELFPLRVFVFFVLAQGGAFRAKRAPTWSRRATCPLPGLALASRGGLLNSRTCVAVLAKA